MSVTRASSRRSRSATSRSAICRRTAAAWISPRIATASPRRHPLSRRRGPRVIASLLTGNMADRAVISISPQIRGQGTGAVGELGNGASAAPLRLTGRSVHLVGDTIIVAADIEGPRSPPVDGGGPPDVRNTRPFGRMKIFIQNGRGFLLIPQLLSPASRRTPRRCPVPPRSATGGSTWRCVPSGSWNRP